MQKADCSVSTSHTSGLPIVKCNELASVKCGGYWFCAEHYDLFHEGGECLHLLPDEE